MIHIGIVKMRNAPFDAVESVPASVHGARLRAA
jgi:hypothetical protein